LAIAVLAVTIIVIVFAMVIPARDASVSLAVIQGMTVIISSVIGFYFGNRSAERAEERVREVERQLAGGASAIQQERIKRELKDIFAKQTIAIELAQKASDLHQGSQKIDADWHFEDADRMTEYCRFAMKAWIKGNHGYLILDEKKPDYEKALRLFKESVEFHKNTDIPNDIFPKRTYLGKAVAEIQTGRDDDAIESLNRIGKDIKKMKDLFDQDDIRLRDIDMFLNPNLVHKINPIVQDYLREKQKEKIIKRDKDNDFDT